jgi:hypothetical protein
MGIRKVAGSADRGKAAKAKPGHARAGAWLPPLFPPFRRAAHGTLDVR